MDSWKVSLPCNKAEAEALQEDFTPLALLDFPPVLMTTEPEAAKPVAAAVDDAGPQVNVDVVGTPDAAPPPVEPDEGVHDDVLRHRRIIQ